MSEEIVDANLNEEVVETPQPPSKPVSIGIKLQGCTQDIIGYLSDDKEGNRWMVQNPAEIHYKSDEKNREGVFRIVFVPCSPASEGVLFVPYGQINYVFEPKADIKLEYESKFQHTATSTSSRTPKFEG